MTGGFVPAREGYMMADRRPDSGAGTAGADAKGPSCTARRPSSADPAPDSPTGW